MYKAIKREREKIGMTTEEAAKICGLSEKIYREREEGRGKMDFRVRHLYALADAFQVEPADLLDL